MKSTKYQLLESDFKALQKDIRLYRNRIKELENKQPVIISGTIDFPALTIKWNGFVYRRQA
jgi:rubrerythrin